MLKPTPEVTNALGYCVGIAKQRDGVELHSLSAMSNHEHMDATDPFGDISKFEGYFKSLTARSLNCHYGRWEYSWAPRDGRQDVTSRQAAIAGMAYIAANPVLDGIVSHGIQWEGVRTRPEQLGTTRTIARPRIKFFPKKSKMPAEVEFTLSIPRGLIRDSSGWP